MTFLNVSLLAGLGLVAVPIVLHLMMRRQPKQHPFPALRFVRRRQIANTQRLQLRHWLLLALRCAALALGALALARPTVASGAIGSWLIAGALGLAALFVGVLWLVALSRDLSRVWSITLAAVACVLLAASGTFAFGAWRGGGAATLGEQEAPVAAAIVIDTAPHMEYRHENHTRLEVTKETAEWLIQQLPSDSDVAVIDSSTGQAAFAIDRAAAIKTVARLRYGPLARPLPEVLRQAYALLTQSEKQRREVYVLSDLSMSAWKAEGNNVRPASDKGEIPVYVVDVGVEEPKNVVLEPLRLPSEALPRGAELTLEAAVVSRAISGQRTIEVAFDVPDPSLPVINNGELVLPKQVVRASQTVNLTPGQPASARFTLPVMPSGVHHGVARILGDDGLPLDDTRYFTLEVEEPRPLLVVAGPGVAGRDFAEAVAPQALRDRGESRFTCDVVSQADLATVELDRYAAATLLDPAPLSSDDWNRINNFARSGRGLAIFLGSRAEPIDTFNEAAAHEVIGGRIGGRLKQPARTVPGEVFLAPESLDHPVFGLYRRMNTSVPWDRFPVYFYWPVDQFAGDARVLARYSNRQPAVIENSLGRGRVLVFNTPANEPLTPRGRACWNELWSGEDAWPWFVLVNESLRYVARLGEGRLNYETGETVVLQNDAERYPQSYQAFTPSGEVQTVAARDDQLTIRFNDQPGTYRLRGIVTGPVGRGFSSNLAADATELARIDAARLDGILGAGRYQLARNREEIHRVVGQQRVGREMAPYVLALLAGALLLEHFLANRFYSGQGEPTESSGWTKMFGSWRERLRWRTAA
jgi:hypothetical protein